MNTETGPTLGSSRAVRVGIDTDPATVAETLRRLRLWRLTQHSSSMSDNGSAADSLVVVSS